MRTANVWKYGYGLYLLVCSYIFPWWFNSISIRIKIKANQTIDIVIHLQFEYLLGYSALLWIWFFFSNISHCFKNWSSEWNVWFIKCALDFEYLILKVMEMMRILKNQKNTHFHEWCKNHFDISPIILNRLPNIYSGFNSSNFK